MQYNTRRAILRRVKNGGDMKLAFETMMKDKRYGVLTYGEFLKVRTGYLKKKVHDGYKWCNMCGCDHPYTYEVFGYNGFNGDGTRRLHSTCLKGRLRLKKNIVIMKDSRHEGIKASSRKSNAKNGYNHKRKKIYEMTPEERVIQREKWRLASAKKYLRQTNGKKKEK